MDVAGDLLGAALLGVGVALGVARSKRRFDRRNQLGVERFATFGSKLWGKSGDYLLNVCALGSLAVGAIVLASNRTDTWGWIIMAPVCVFMLYLLLGS